MKTTLVTLSDYGRIIPRSKLEVLDNAYQGLKDNLANYHIDPIAFAVLTKVITEFTPLVEDWENPHTCTPEVRKKMRDYEKTSTPIVVHWLSLYVLNNPFITPAERVGMGLPAEPRRKPVPRPAPAQQPVAEYITKRGGLVDFRLYNSPSSKRFRKPAGAIGCEFFMGMGEHLTPDQCTKHSLITKSSFIIEFDRSAWGNMHTAYFRWYSAKGEAGPWSPPCFFVPM
ncbi:hypothetical protein Barb6XT_00518 [Bacteroidales bacterium Barb6XT]|nr:hypothetical protein Barb6XT_00518 [Bacteroidales bacterium Barb6XT]